MKLASNVCCEHSVMNWILPCWSMCSVHLWYWQVCSAVQLTGLVLCLHGAAKITHRAQRIVGIVSQWHALATCNPSAVTASTDADNFNSDPLQRSPAAVLYGPAHPLLYNDSCDDLESSMPRIQSDVEQSIHDFEAYQKRQALGKFQGSWKSVYTFDLLFPFLFSSTLFMTRDMYWSQ